ncbi:MAG: hypothetical protein Q7T96_19770 [Methylobacter sp.]|nr:hypothetical protein [Methylobacter sp.]
MLIGHRFSLAAFCLRHSIGKAGNDETIYRLYPAAVILEAPVLAIRSTGSFLPAKLFVV